MSFITRADKPSRTREQVAREVHAVSLGRNLDELATVIALMTISTEVGSNDVNGERQWWCPFNRKDPQSEQFPHDSESDDGLSSGYFQQQVSAPGVGPRPWGWGGLFGDINGTRKRMTLADSANMFLAALSDDYPQAADNPAKAGEFAQRVQGSGFGDRYQDKWDEAWAMLRSALAQGDPVAPNPIAPVCTQSGDPVWLEDILRPALGDRLKTLDGWKDSGVGGTMGQIWGVIWHHTGNANADAGSIRNGRPDLAGPLAQLHIAQDGTVTIVAVGPCNHAGEGSWHGLPTDNANSLTIGIECAWPKDGSINELTQTRERWPDAQIVSMRDVGAALTLHLGVDASHNISHSEWARFGPAGWRQGKWDPGNLDMNWFRGEIAKDMRGDFDDKPPVQPDVTSVTTPAPQQVVNPRSDRVLLEEIWTALKGPDGNGWPQLGGKSFVDFFAELAAGSPPAPAKKSSPRKAPAKKTAAKKTAAKKTAAKKTA
jgi:hypothetical protein